MEVKTGAVILVVVLIFGGMVGLAGLYLNEANQRAVDKASEKPKLFDYSGKNVDYAFVIANKYTGALYNGTVYLWTSQPSTWENCRSDVASGFVETGTAVLATGLYTASQHPGKYYYQVESWNNALYCEFGTIDIPSSGDASLSDYNQAPLTEKVNMVDEDASFAVANIDLGIITNETTDRTYTATGSYTVAADHGVFLDDIKVQEDGTYSFATDADGDGIYDEGVNKIELTFDGGAAGKCGPYVPFDVANTIDEFSGDNEFTTDCNLEMGEGMTFTITAKITCDATLFPAVGDADELCNNGEDFIDDIILVTKLARTDTVAITG